MMVTQDFDNHEDLIEYNFLQKIKKSVQNLNSKGYKIRKSGDLLDTKVKLISRETYYGNILPHRNLNFPKSNYFYRPPLFERKTYVYSLNQPDGATSDEEHFPKMNLNELNKSPDPHSIEKNILSFISFLGLDAAYYIHLDFGIYSSYKLFIEDSNGKLVAGKNDQSFEFHSLRLENCKLINHFGGYFFFLHIERLVMTSILLEDRLDSFFVIDFDGFMNKNLLIT